MSSSYSQTLIQCKDESCMYSYEKKELPANFSNTTEATSSHSTCSTSTDVTAAEIVDFNPTCMLQDLFEDFENKKDLLALYEKNKKKTTDYCDDHITKQEEDNCSESLLSYLNDEHHRYLRNSFGKKAVPVSSPSSSLFTSFFSVDSLSLESTGLNYNDNMYSFYSDKAANKSLFEKTRNDKNSANKLTCGEKGFFLEPSANDKNNDNAHANSENVFFFGKQKKNDFFGLNNSTVLDSKTTTLTTVASFEASTSKTDVFEVKYEKNSLSNLDSDKKEVCCSTSAHEKDTSYLQRTRSFVESERELNNKTYSDARTKNIGAFGFNTEIQGATDETNRKNNSEQLNNSQLLKPSCLDTNENWSNLLNANHDFRAAYVTKPYPSVLLESLTSFSAEQHEQPHLKSNKHVYNEDVQTRQNGQPLIALENMMSTTKDLIYPSKLLSNYQVEFGSNEFFNLLKQLPPNDFAYLARTVARYRRRSRVEGNRSTIVSVNLCGCCTPHIRPVSNNQLYNQFWFHRRNNGTSISACDAARSIILVELHTDLNVTEFVERRLPVIVRRQVGNKLNEDFVVQIFGISFLKEHLLNQWHIGDLPECTQADIERLCMHPLYRHMLNDVLKRTTIPSFRNLNLCAVYFSPHRHR